MKNPQQKAPSSGLAKQQEYTWETGNMPFPVVRENIEEFLMDISS